jgi:hypothetical protein
VALAEVAVFRLQALLELAVLATRLQQLRHRATTVAMDKQTVLLGPLVAEAVLVPLEAMVQRQMAEMEATEQPQVLVVRLLPTVVVGVGERKELELAVAEALVVVGLVQLQPEQRR